jgi:hypothetical protein
MSLTIAQRYSLRCFDNRGESFDRYTIVFPDGDALAVGPTGNHPQGVCMWIGRGIDFDLLGAELTYEELPEAVRMVIETEYLTWYMEPKPC